jgi:hypothetical protein
MESIGLFCGLLLIPAAIGAVAYLVCRKMRPTPRHLLFGLGFYVLLSFFFGIFPIGLAFLMVGAIISKAGAVGHTKSVERCESGWESPYDLVLLATLMTIFAGAAALIPISSSPSKVIVENLELFLLLYSFSLVSSASLMPYLIWMGQSLRLRPGMDEHFEEEGDTLP